MKTLYLDSIGLMLDMAMRTPGSVLVTQDTKTAGPNIGKGLVTREKESDKGLREADIIVVGDVGYGEKTDKIRKMKKNVIGASSNSEKLELDRRYGQHILSEAGIKVLPSFEFSSLREGRKFVEKSGDLWVSKPNDDKNDKSLSYVPDSKEDLLFMMGRWEKSGKIKSPFLLQKKIGGIEMAVGGWWNGSAWVSGMCCENFEFKKFMAGDVGMNTGEAGTVLKYVPLEKSKIGKAVLKPIEPFLKSFGGTGYVDINCIVDDKGNIWPLEFTTRFGYPTISIQQPLHNGSLDALWLSILSGKDFAFDTEKVALGIVVAIPDYPYSKATAKEVEDFPIKVEAKDVTPYHWYEVQNGENGFSSAGDYLGVVSLAGTSIGELRRKTVDAVKKIKIAVPKLYRVDIGSRLTGQIPELWTHGIATHWKGFV